MEETKALARFAAAKDAESLPDAVRERVKACLLDYLGAAVYCSQSESSNNIKAYARSLQCSGPSTILQEDWKTAPHLAAMVNATMGHGFELDDFHGKAFIHPGTVILPAALATAEEAKADGPGFISAVAAAYEVMIRLGMALTVAHNLRGFHPTGTTGPFAAAMAAGKLLGFGQEQLLNALGVAGSMASGIKEFYLRGDMVKRLHAGRAAEGGLTAAKVVAAGFDGPETVLEGKFGFFHAFTDSPRIEALTEGLDRDWHLLEINVKPYACCGGIHSAIAGMLDLKERGLDPAEIQDIAVETCEKVAVQNSGPGTASVMAAQYSIPFTVALTLLQDIEDPTVYQEAMLGDPRVVDLSKKVRVAGSFKDAGMERARITASLRDGSQMVAEVHAPRGHPNNPLHYEDLVRKFRLLAAGHWSEERIEAIIEQVGTLEEMQDMRQLTSLLAA